MTAPTVLLILGAILAAAVSGAAVALLGALVDLVAVLTAGVAG